MIEILKSKRGSDAAKFNGVYVHSSVDPIKEAEAWARSYYNHLVGVPNVIVFGCGLGYHIKALADAFPNQKILTIERVYEFSTLAQNILNSYSNVEVLNMELSDILSNEHIRRAVSQLYMYVEIPSLVKIDKAYYDELKTMLSGRTSKSLDFIVECRKDHKNFFVRRPHIYKNSIITIKSINDNSMKPENTYTRQEIIWKTLGELVK